MSDLDTIKAAVHAALDERDGLDRETHRAHHDYVARRIAREIKREERRAELSDKIRATVIGGLVLTLVTAAGTGLYNVGKFVIELYQKSHTGQ